MTGPLTGSRAWVVQRLSALYLLGVLVFVLVRLVTGVPSTYDAWRAWVLAPATSVAILLFFVALLLHAWVGLRDVILDYAHSAALRFTLLALVAAGEIAIGAWVLTIIIAYR